jgi:hypothetical protein
MCVEQSRVRIAIPKKCCVHKTKRGDSVLNNSDTEPPRSGVIEGT